MCTSVQRCHVSLAAASYRAKTQTRACPTLHIRLLDRHCCTGQFHAGCTLCGSTGVLSQLDARLCCMLPLCLLPPQPRGGTPSAAHQRSEPQLLEEPPVLAGGELVLQQLLRRLPKRHGHASAACAGAPRMQRQKRRASAGRMQQLLLQRCWPTLRASSFLSSWSSTSAGTAAFRSRSSVYRVGMMCW